MENQVKEILMEIWLEENEVKIYLEALRLWNVPASIIANKLWIPRTTARHWCEQLIKKQLMIWSNKWNTKYFLAEHPNKIKTLIKIKKNILEEKEEETDKIMWDLIKLQNPYTNLPKVTYYEGIEWVMKMLIDNHSAIKADTFEFSAHIPLLKKYPKEIWEYSDIHMQHRINNKNYVLDCIENKSENDKESYPNLHFKYYPDKNLNIKTHLQIDWDKIAIVSTHWEKPMWIDIHHKEIAEDLKKIFKQLWKLLWSN